jgi:hypothetical protein
LSVVGDEGVLGTVDVALQERSKPSLTLTLSLPRRARGKQSAVPGVAFFFLAPRSGGRIEVRGTSVAAAVYDRGLFTILIETAVIRLRGFGAPGGPPL